MKRRQRQSKAAKAQKARIIRHYRDINKRSHTVRTLRGPDAIDRAIAYCRSDESITEEWFDGWTDR